MAQAACRILRGTAKRGPGSVAEWPTGKLSRILSHPQRAAHSVCRVRQLRLARRPGAPVRPGHIERRPAARARGLSARRRPRTCRRGGPTSDRDRKGGEAVDGHAVGLLPYPREGAVSFVEEHAVAVRGWRLPGV